jgi:RNA polymerase sigma factor (sigma-70 family)
LSRLDSGGRPPDRADEAAADSILLDRLRAELNRAGRPPEGDARGDDLLGRFLLFHSRLFAIMARGRRSPDADREDGVQDLWVVLMTRLPGFRYDPGRGRFSAWVSAVARNTLADRWRRRRFERSMRRFVDASEESIPDPGRDPAVACELEDSRRAVRAALVELRRHVSARDYKAFLLHWRRGASVREVAAKLGMTEAQVWSSHHRTKEKLRPLLMRRLGPGYFE